LRGATKNYVKRAFAAAARSPYGARALAWLARAEPQLLIEALGPRLNRDPRLGTVRAWPQQLIAFEDLAFLFASTQLNHGIVSLAIDEAAYLFRLARSLGPATIIEIGRYKGGSTLVLAAAMDDGSTLYSYDLHVKRTGEYVGAELDAEVIAALDRYRLRDRVHVVVADSKSVEPPAASVDLLFVDGDHSYAGVRGDYEHWRSVVRRGGHLLFHDAAALRDFAVRDENVARLMNEIRRDDAGEFSEVGGAGALLHFVRTGGP